MTHENLVLCFLRSALTVALLAPSPLSAQDTSDRLIGSYRTETYTQTAPDGSMAYVVGSFDFDGHRNVVKFTSFADPDLTQPIFTYRSEGPIDIQRASETFAGGWEVISRNDISTIEIYIDAPDIWQSLGLGACPLEVGTAVEISDCVQGGPFNIAGCAEFDVLWLSPDGQSFRTGGGDVNRCETYPTELGEFEFLRIAE